MNENGKITMVQATLLSLVMTYSASTRVIPKFTVSKAKQAAWLCPMFGIISIIILMLIIYSFVKKHPGKSFADIIYEICGKAIGKLIIVLYIIWLMVLLSLYTRYFGERLVGTIYPSTDNKLFIVILLLLVNFILRSEIVILGRMNKIIFALLVIQFYFIMALLLVKIDVKFITPISTLDIVPVLEGSIVYTGIGVYVFYFFMISDKIITNKGFKKNMTWSAIFYFLSITILIISLVGTFGHQTLNKLPLPLLMAIKNISKVGTFSGLEALFLSLWLMADFITVSLFTYIVLNLLKSLFNLDSYMNFLSILLIFTFILSQFLSVDIFELQSFSSNIGLQINAATGFVLPVFLFILGKIRNKI